MNDMSTMSVSEQKKEYADMLDAREQLEYLKQSEVVRLVLDGKYKPWELDSAYRNLRKRLREMEHTHQLDMSTIVAYRRQIEFLTEVER